MKRLRKGPCTGEIGGKGKEGRITRAGKGRVVLEGVQYLEGADTGGQGGRRAHRRHPKPWKVVGGSRRRRGWRAAPTRALRAARAATPSLAAGESGLPLIPEPSPPAKSWELAAGRVGEGQSRSPSLQPRSVVVP